MADAGSDWRSLRVSLIPSGTASRQLPRDRHAAYATVMFDQGHCKLLVISMTHAVMMVLKYSHEHYFFAHTLSLDNDVCCHTFSALLARGSVAFKFGCA